MVPPASIEDLLDSMGFRHFIRHTYAVYFDSSRLGALLERLATVAPPVERSLEVFDDFFEQAVTQAEP